MLIQWLEAVVEGRAARWLRTLVFTMLAGLVVALLGLLVAMNVTAIGGPDETLQVVAVDSCSVRLIYRPALIMYGDLILDVRRSDGTRIVRDRVTRVDHRDDATEMIVRRSGRGTVAVFRADDARPIEAPLALPADCLD